MSDSRSFSPVMNQAVLPIPRFIRPMVKWVVAIPGRILPYGAQKPILSMVLNEAFREPLQRGELESLEGLNIRIRVTDMNFDWLIRMEADRLVPAEPSGKADVSISGESLDFVLLATRRADPDTLFFQRRIRIEGDTEMGLAVKNTMDGMDWEDLPLPLRRLLQAVSRLVGKLQI